MIDFPDVPSVGQHAFVGGASFAWDGIAWNRASYVSVPSATLTSLVPNTAIQGAAAKSIQINGTGFLADSVVQADGVTIASTFVSATQMTATVPSLARGGPTTQNIRVLNTDITGTFNSNNLPITYDGPRITSVSPNRLCDSKWVRYSEYEIDPSHIHNAGTRIGTVLLASAMHSIINASGQP